jgi:hypothetical protein
MTTDATVATTDTKAAYLRQPRTIRLALLAAFVTAVLAGPVTMTLFVAAQAVQGMSLFRFHDVTDMAADIAEVLMYSTLYGLVGSIPAAGVNTLLLAYLARRRRDAVGLAIGSGHAFGFLVGVTIATIIFLFDDMFTARAVDRLIEFALNIGLPMLVAGGFMGALHWSIAIRPRRRWRLFQERERAALLAME